MRASEDDYLNSLREHLDFGLQLVLQGAPAIDIVEAVTIRLEDDPLYKAGHGSIASETEDVTMDAAIMDGHTRNFGAVTTLRSVRNPVQAAKYLMQNRPESIVAGPGAEEIAINAGLTAKPRSYFCVSPRPGPETDGTVGVIALDMHGNLAAATSTGGYPGHNVSKWRIGDIPIIGAGTFADNRSCAISTCGYGEKLISAGLSRRVTGRIEFLQASASAAVSAEMEELSDEAVFPAGIICLDHNGELGVGVTPAFAMAYASISSEQEALVKLLKAES
ncbi:MAG: isoaspartyl peptidase/L-asparaginase [Alphaproteobacteria bacterium]